MLTITSRDNPQIKQVRALLSGSRARREAGHFVCEGSPSWARPCAGAARPGPFSAWRGRSTVSRP